MALYGMEEWVSRYGPEISYVPHVYHKRQTECFTCGAFMPGKVRFHACYTEGVLHEYHIGRDPSGESSILEFSSLDVGRPTGERAEKLPSVLLTRRLACAVRMGRAT